MTTDKCASTIAERKYGGFAEQNRVNASLGFSFPCMCAHLLRNDIDSQHLLSLIALFAQIYMLA